MLISLAWEERVDAISGSCMRVPVPCGLQNMGSMVFTIHRHCSNGVQGHGPSARHLGKSSVELLEQARQY